MSSQSTTGANPNSVTGCLSGSAASGTYTLVSQTGTTYVLSGNTDKLRTHIGEEIQVTGQLSSAGSSSMSSSPSATANAGTSPNDMGQASASANQNASSATATGAAGTSTSTATSSGSNVPFQVTDVTKIADHCTQQGSKPTSQLSAPFATAGLLAMNGQSSGSGTSASGTAGQASGTAGAQRE